MLSQTIEQYANLTANESKKGKLFTVLVYFCLFVGEEKQSSSTQREMLFLKIYLSEGMNGTMKVGQQVKDFIKSCTFGGLDCQMDNGYLVPP